MEGLMMTPQEIAYGNWVTDSEASIPMKIIGIFEDTTELTWKGYDDIWEEDTKDLYPIPLTERIIGKFGFTLFKGGCGFWNYRMETSTHIIHLETIDGKSECTLHVMKKNQPQPFHHQMRVSSVHELQNALQFATKETFRIEL